MAIIKLKTANGIVFTLDGATLTAEDPDCYVMSAALSPEQAGELGRALVSLAEAQGSIEPPPTRPVKGEA